MPVSALPIPAVASGNVLTSTNWNAIVKDNLNKLLNTGHRTLTVAQFAALTGLEGTKGVVAGDEVYLEADATNGVLWHLVYESTETTYKWRFLGGRPMFAVVATSETGNSATFVDLTTVGPSITVPRAGDYDVDFGGYLQCSIAGSPAVMSPKKGANATSDSDGTEQMDGAAGNIAFRAGGPPVRFTAMAASDVVKLQYRGQSVTSQDRRLFVTPVRLV